MIAANELRIDVFVTHEERFIRIESIDKDMGVNAYLNESSRQRWIEFADINPIPLTLEILEKCGFELKKSDNWTEYRLGIIGFDFNHSMLSGCHIGGEEYHYIEVSYLHQLQNLYFSLTGGELEVRL